VGSPLDWLETPQLPKTRRCPKCDGAGEQAHPDFAKAWALVEETLAPVAPKLKALQDATGQTHHQTLVETAKQQLLTHYPPQPCELCKGTGTLPMEGALR
jgi:hypothetical protein